MIFQWVTLGKLPGKMLGKFGNVPGSVADWHPRLNQRLAEPPMSLGQDDELARQLAHELAHPECLGSPLNSLAFARHPC